MIFIEYTSLEELSKKKIVLSYRAAVDIVAAFLNDFEKRGELKQFCESYDVSYETAISFRSRYNKMSQHGFIEEQELKNNKFISKILSLAGYENSIEKAHLAHFLVTDHQSKNKILSLMKQTKQDVARLERIDLVYFAKHNGYKINTRETERFNESKGINDVWVMEHPSKGEVIIRKTIKGAYWYTSTSDSYDKGNIIDFVRNRIWLVGYDKAIELILDWIDEEEILVEEIQEKSTLEDEHKDIIAEQKKLLKDYLLTTSDLTDPSLLLERNIELETLEHPCFKGAIFNKEVLDELGNKLFNNVVFPIYELQEEGNFIIGVEELTRDLRRPIKEVDVPASGIWVSRFALGSFKKDETGNPKICVYVGENAIDCLAYYQLHKDSFSDNYVFVSTAGAYNGVPQKLKALQDFVQLIKADSVVLINKNTLEGKTADFLLYSQLYAPSMIKTRYEIGDEVIEVEERSEEQTYSPRFSMVKVGSKIRVNIEVPYKDDGGKDKRNKVLLITDTMRKFVPPRELVGNWGFVPCDQRQVSVTFMAELNENMIERLLNMAIHLQPEKKQFLKVIKSQALDFSQELNQSMEQKQKEKQEQKKKNAFGLGIDILRT